MAYDRAANAVIRGRDFEIKKTTSGFLTTADEDNIMKLVQSNLIYDSGREDWYNRWTRFYYLDPFNVSTTHKEYIFFTKPDLHIVDDINTNLQPELQKIPFFNEIIDMGYQDLFDQLRHTNDGNNFMNIFTNGFASDQALDVPSISATEIETSSTFEGAMMKYQWTSIESDFNHDFTLEFVDTKYLEIYRLFKIWDWYERLKSLGLITPDVKYIRNREIHDQVAVYKFVVGADNRTLVYWAKGIGVYPKGTPRDVFSQVSTTDGPIKYSVSFNCSFIEDMDPLIIDEFNDLTGKGGTYVPFYNKNIGKIDGSWVDYARINYHAKDENKASMYPYGKYTLDWYSYDYDEGE